MSNQERQSDELTLLGSMYTLKQEGKQYEIDLEGDVLCFSLPPSYPGQALPSVRLKKGTISEGEANAKVLELWQKSFNSPVMVRFIQWVKDTLAKQSFDEEFSPATTVVHAAPTPIVQATSSFSSPPAGEIVEVDVASVPPTLVSPSQYNFPGPSVVPLGEEGLCYNTAVVLSPPLAQWEAIQAIRRRLDVDHVDIWPPHVTLFYPFYQPSELPAAGSALQRIAKTMAPFTIRLDKFGHFSHGNKGVVTWLSPDPNKKITDLRQALWKVVPGCQSTFKQPHMTVARGQSDSQAPSLQKGWRAVEFECTQLTVLQRTNNKTPMEVKGYIYLGDGPSEMKRSSSPSPSSSSAVATAASASSSSSSSSSSASSSSSLSSSSSVASSARSRSPAPKSQPQASTQKQQLQQPQPKNQQVPFVPLDVTPKQKTTSQQVPFVPIDVTPKQKTTTAKPTTQPKQAEAKGVATTTVPTQQQKQDPAMGFSQQCLQLKAKPGLAKKQFSVDQLVALYQWLPGPFKKQRPNKSLEEKDIRAWFITYASQLPTTTQSDSTRFMRPELMLSPQAKDEGSAGESVTGVFMVKNFLRQLSACVVTGVLDAEEWTELTRYITVDMETRFPEPAQKAALKQCREQLSQVVPIPEQQEPDKKAGLQSMFKYFITAESNGVLSRTQHFFLKNLVASGHLRRSRPKPEEGEEDGDPAVLQDEEVRVLQAVFESNFSFGELSYEQRWEGSNLKFSILCRSAGAKATSSSVRVVVVFPKTYPFEAPQLSLVEVVGVTQGEITVLQSLLEGTVDLCLSGPKRGEPMIFTLMTLVLTFLNDTQTSGSTQTASIPYLPPSFESLTKLSTDAAPTSLAQLDRALRLALENKIGKEYTILGVENVISPALLKRFVQKLTSVAGRTPEEYTAMREKERWRIPPTNGLGGLAGKRKTAALRDFGRETPRYEGEWKEDFKDDIYGVAVAFHGTRRRKNLSSIAREGFLAAGSLNERGETIQVASGSRYGEGVYLSPTFSFSDHYAYHDSEGVGQLFVSLVMLGRVCRLSHYWYGEGAHQREEPGFDSHVSPDGNEFVVFDEAQVLPGLLVTYAPVGYSPRCVPQVTMQKKTKQRDIDELNRLREQGVCFRRVPGTPDKWMVSLDKPELDRLDKHFQVFEEATPVHLIYILDRSRSMGTTFKKLLLPACAQLHRTVRPEVSAAVFFGSTVEAFSSEKVSSAAFFERPDVMEMKLQDQTDIVGGFTKALDIALRDKEKYAKLDEDRQVKAALEERKEELMRLRKIKPEEWSPLDEKELMDGALKKKGGVHSNVPQRLFVFVFMSDGQDTVNEKNALENALAKSQKLVQGAKLDAIFKVVGIGSQSDTQVGMRVKLCIQTVKLWESTPCHYAKMSSQLAVTVQELCDDLKEVTTSRTINVEITQSQDLVGAGFVQNFTRPPESEVVVRPRASGRTTLLFAASHNRLPPQYLQLNGCMLPAYAVEEHDLESPLRQASLLELLASLVNDIKVAAVARMDPSKALNALTDIVKAVKQSNFTVDTLKNMPSSQRVDMMKTKRRLVTEMESLLNGLHEEVLMARTAMNSDQQATWLNQASNMKYGAKALKLAAKHGRGERMLAVNVLHDLAAAVQKFQQAPQINQDEFTSVFSLQTARQHMAEITDASATLAPVLQPTFQQEDPLASRLQPLVLTSSPLTMSEILYSFGMVGIMIMLGHRSEAANIDPWQVQVGYVSSDKGDSASAMCALHAQAELKDSLGQQVEDVLLLLDPQDPYPYKCWARTRLHDVYTAVVITRNPSLTLPSQRTALLVVSLVKAIEQLTNPQFRTIENVTTVLNIVYTVRDRFRVGEKGYWTDLLTKMAQPNPGRCMTEADEDDINTVCKILAALCCCHEHVSELGLFSSATTLMGELALALMAESVSRGARVLVKTEYAKQMKSALPAPTASGGATPTQAEAADEKSGSSLSVQSVSQAMLVKALGITPETCRHVSADDEDKEDLTTPHSNAYDANKASQASARFFGRSWTNCSPQAVAACLGFARALHAWERGAVHNFEDLMEGKRNDQASDLAAYLFTQFEEGSGGMGKFLSLYTVPPSETKKEAVVSYSTSVQSALYVQGLRHFSSKTRRLGLPSVNDPCTVIAGLAVEMRKLLFQNELAAKVKRLNSIHRQNQAGVRMQHKRQNQTMFMLLHSGTPKLFTQSQINSLNALRPKDDQLILLDTGLLKHHCTFPECPVYLVNQATPNDLLKNQRTGLFKHLSLMLYPEPFYAKASHQIGRSTFLGNKGATQAQFVNLMMERARNPKSAAASQKEFFSAMFDDYTKYFKDAVAI